MNQTDNTPTSANTPKTTPKTKSAAGNGATDVTTGGGGAADPAARKARLKQVDEHLGAIKTLEQIDDHVCQPDAKTVQSMNVKYGKDLPDVGLALADAVEGCTEAFDGTDITAASVRDKEGRVQELTSTLEKLTQTRQVVADALREAQVSLFVVTDMGGQIIKATLQNPATKKSVSEDLTASSRKFRGLVGDRSAAIATLRDGKKAAKGEVLADLTDSDVSLQETQADLAKAQLQIKYMQGEKLRPDDVIEVANATAAAPRANQRKGAAPAGSAATPAKPRAPRGKGKAKAPATAPGTPTTPAKPGRRISRGNSKLH